MLRNQVQHLPCGVRDALMAVTSGVREQMTLVEASVIQPKRTESDI